MHLERINVSLRLRAIGPWVFFLLGTFHRLIQNRGLTTQLEARRPSLPTLERIS